MNDAPKLTPHEERAVAVRAPGATRARYAQYLAGRPVRSTVAARVAESLQARVTHVPTPTGGPESRMG